MRSKKDDCNMNNRLLITVSADEISILVKLENHRPMISIADGLKANLIPTNSYCKLKYSQHLKICMKANILLANAV